MAVKKTLKCKVARHRRSLRRDKKTPKAPTPKGKVPLKPKVKRPPKKQAHKPKAQKTKQHLKDQKAAPPPPKTCKVPLKQG